MARRYGIILGLSILISSCQASPTFLNPVSPISRKEANLYWVVLVLALIVFVGVELGLLFIIIWDKKKPGDESLAPQIYHNKRLEFIWTAVPVILVIILFIMTVHTVLAVSVPKAASTDLNVRVIGHRWWWEFDYTDLGIATANELHIPEGKTVQLSLESVDVIHSFWVPQLSGKTDVIPGQHNKMWVKGDKVGEYLGQCAEFCGTEHALMRFKVLVNSQADFDAWVANQQQPVYQPQTADEQAGQKIIIGTCETCHSLDPAEMDTKKLGPNLTHLLSRTTFAGGVFDTNEQNLRAWLKDPQDMKPGNDMQIKLSADEIDQIMAYLKNLK